MLKKTPLYEHHVRLGAKIDEFGGYWMPIQYTSIIKEHMAVRTRVGVFDVSHMGEILVEGSSAPEYLNGILSNDVFKLKPNRIQYHIMTYQDGGAIDDLLVYQLMEDSYLLVPNASNAPMVLEHLNATAGEGIIVKDVSETLGLLAVQGPDSPSVMKDFPGVDKLKPFTFGHWNHKGQPAMISRTGYTGEDGFEIYGPPDMIAEIFDELIDEGVTPCGLGARDTLRFEAGLPLFGHELLPDITPVEAGLERFVSLNKDFPGSDVLASQIQDGTGRRLVGLKLLDRGVPRQGYKVFCRGDEVGEVTSGTFAPYLREYLAMALIDESFTGESSFEMQIRGKLLRTEVVPKNFLSQQRRKSNE